MGGTNSNIILPAAALASRMGQGCTFSSIIYRKVGKEVGPKGAKVRVGNDLMKYLFISGFRYDTLCQRSLDRLALLDADALLAEWGGTVGGHAIDRAGIVAAMDEVRDSLTLSRDGKNESTTDDVFEPLIVDGITVRGGRVYTGGKASPVGTLYVQGLVVNSTVLEAGNPVPPHKYREARTAAKDTIRGMLPSAKYASYRLEPGGEWFLKVGGSAVAECGDQQVRIDADLLAAAETAAA